MVWLWKAVKQEVCILSDYVSTVLLISANNLDLFMALKAMLVFFMKPSVMLLILWVCACVWCRTKGVNEEDLRYKEEFKSK